MKQFSRTLSPLKLPNSGEEHVDFLPVEMRKEISTILDAAKKDRRWELPVALVFNPKDPLFWAYVIFKTSNPTTRARAGSGLESYFEAFKQCHFDLEPENFIAEQTLSLSAVGDLMSTPPNMDSAQDHLYASAKELIFNADISYANLESILTGASVDDLGSGEETPYTYATPEEFHALLSHEGNCHDLVHMANNHVMDFGEESVRATLQSLNTLGIEQIGVNASEEQSNTLEIKTVNGVRIGWIAHSYGLNGQPQPEGKPWYMNVVDYHTTSGPDICSVISTIQKCRNAGCDFVFLSVHWGPEWEFYPLPDQVKWAHDYAEAGADALIGHHPHVIQPVEIYHPANFPDKSVPIVYSLGNLTPVNRHAGTVLTMVARLTLSVGAIIGKPRSAITALELVPMATVAVNNTEEPWPELHTLAELMIVDKSQELAEHVSSLAYYADMFLGKQWRLK